MKSKSAEIASFMALNFAAAYVPTVFWLPGIPGIVFDPATILFSPLLLLLLFLHTESLVLGCLLLATFVVLIVVASVYFYPIRWLWFVIPGLLLAASLAQGLIAADFLFRLDAVGHS